MKHNHIGSIKPQENDCFGKDYITDVTILNSRVGNGSLKKDGVIRTVSSKRLEIYLEGEWRVIPTSITFNKSIEYIPVGLTSKLDTSTGSSVDNLGLNGLPITNKYKTVMGAYGYPSTTGGRKI